MKKQLMTTTALVAAGVVAAGATPAMAKPKAKIAGWMEGIIGFVDQDVNSGTIDAQWDSEIHFKISEKLDNGMKVSGRVELEGFQNGDQIDEAYLQVAGSWGALRVGQEDNAAFLMATGFSGSWATNVGQNTNFDIQDFLGSAPTVGGNAARHDRVGRLDLTGHGGDAEKIVYFSPKISGFQAAASWMPGNEGGEDANNTVANAAAGNGTNGWALGAKYSTKFDGFGLGVAAGYAEFLDNGTSDTIEDSKPQGYHVSGKLQFGKITVAAGYLKEMNLDNDTQTNNVDDRENIDLGAKYDGGKNKFSIGYVNAKATGLRGDAKDDETNQIMVSYRRELGPGVQYRLNFMYLDSENDLPAAAIVNGNDKNEGFAVSTSVRVGF